jgi:hypothetical protein
MRKMVSDVVEKSTVDKIFIRTPFSLRFYYWQEPRESKPENSVRLFDADNVGDPTERIFVTGAAAVNEALFQHERRIGFLGFDGLI